MNIFAIRFLKNWFKDVWVISSVENMARYYATSVTGEFNGEAFTRKDLEAHCIWCKDNEKITSFEFADVIAEGNKIAFRIKFKFINSDKIENNAENMVIFHLDDMGKIKKVWTKSSEKFVK